MIVKIWSNDRKIKRLAAVDTLPALQQKAVDFAICSDGDIKVYMLDGTEIDEEGFLCLAASAGLETPILIATTTNLLTDQGEASPNCQTSESDFVSRVEFQWSSLSEGVIKALEAREPLNSPQRKEVVRMVATACQKVKNRPSAREIRATASYVVMKYPGSLSDPTPSGSASTISSAGLAYSIENRVENTRRGSKHVMEALTGSQVKRQTSHSAYGCIEWQPACNLLMLTELQSSKQILASEALKAPCEQNLSLQKEAMHICYAEIRGYINSSRPAHPAPDVKEAWPLLFTKEHLLDHFQRLTGVCLNGKLSSVPRDEVAELVAFIRSCSKNDGVLEWALKMDQAEAKLGAENAGSICLFPLLVAYFSEDLGQIVQLHEASTEITEDFRTSLPDSPVIVALGQSLFDCSCHLFVDRGLVVQNVSFLVGLELLFALYFCLNIKYAKGVAATMEFIQRYQVGITPSEGTRQEAIRSKGAKSKAMKAAADLDTFKKKWSSLL